MKTKRATIAFFFLLLLFFSSLFPFVLSFSFVTMILEDLGLKKRTFWRFFTQMTANFVRVVFKKSAKCFQRILPICQSVPFAYGRRFSCHLASMLLISLDHLAGFLITLSPNRLFAFNSIFRLKTISKIAIINLRVQLLLVFSSPPFLLLALSFSPFLFCPYYDFLSISGIRNLPFDGFSLKWLKIS